MRKAIIKLLPLCCAVLLGSCVKKELPVKAHVAGDITTASVEMGATYKYQIYYSLKDNKIVGQNEKTLWDLGFETSPTGYHVVLNTAKSMLAFNTGKMEYSAVSIHDTTGFGAHKRWDEASGNLDSTAIGDWRGKKEVYILSLGFNDQGEDLGMAKIAITSVSEQGYQVRFGAINGSWDTTLSIVKDSAYNLSFLSIKTREQVTVEPLKNTWDLAFTQYTHIFYDEVPVMPYLVTGCLLNRYNTTAVKDSTTLFTTISFSNTSAYTFSPSINTIGYDWKTYNGTSYTVNVKDSYIIKDASGVYYKMHFTGFYSTTGTKGSPQWEYKRL